MVSGQSAMARGGNSGLWGMRCDCRSEKSVKDVAEEIEPIAAHDVGDIGLRIAPFSQFCSDEGFVGDIVHFNGDVLAAKAAIQIAADAHVGSTAQQLANMVNVGHDMIECDQVFGIAHDVVGAKKFVEQDGANDATTLANEPDLGVV